MKTAVGWDNIIFTSEGENYIPIIRQIQLDAMKEGMRRAASLCDVDSFGVPCDNEQCKVSILSAAEQLTEKDL